MHNLALLDIQPRLFTLTLNRPDARNALSIELLADLHHHVDHLAALLSSHSSPPHPHVLVLTGAGNSFCAGMDLKQILAHPDNPLNLLSSLASFCVKLRALPCISIAHVNGPAIGGGCGLTTVCDFALSFDDNKLGFPEVDLGVCPAVVAPWLIRKVGPARARSILLAGGLITAARAAELSLLSHSLPSPSDLADAVAQLARRLADGSSIALAATKSLLNDLDHSLDLDLTRRAAKLSADVIAHPDTQASLRAKLA